MEENLYQRILISRTDNIGDVILTLPMAALIKEKYPNSKIIFLGKKYTKPIIDICTNIDEIYDWDEIKKKSDIENEFNKINCDTIIHVFPNKEIAKYAKKSGIKNRIGTNRRLFHWIYCNKNITLSRKKSNLHESQLNLKLLTPLNINTELNINQISKLFGLKIKNKLPEKFNYLIDPSKFNLILHPKSKGSAREWGIDNFVTLANSLPEKSFKVFFSGSTEESNFIKSNIISRCPSAIDVSGLFNLNEFISFIDLCDGLIANSTGPLHIASALGKNTIGLYPPIEAMAPKRWAPIGIHAQYLIGNNISKNEYCDIKCTIQKKCLCMENISPNILLNIITTWKKISNG